jgi:hypothetical protein
MPDNLAHGNESKVETESQNGKVIGHNDDKS